jgi:hypothetical protein
MSLTKKYLLEPILEEIYLERGENPDVKDLSWAEIEQYIAEKKNKSLTNKSNQNERQHGTN